MSNNNKYTPDFIENTFYHVYNRTNNKEKLFLTDLDRRIFVKKYYQYLHPFVYTHAWSLLTNHFHIVAETRSEEEICNNLNSPFFGELTMTETEYLKNKFSLSELLERRFRRFFQSYALYMNNAYKRKGNLFYKHFKRVELLGAPRITKAITYVHANPQNHGLIDDFTKYEWSSWRNILDETRFFPDRNRAIEFFGGRESFIESHMSIITPFEITSSPQSPLISTTPAILLQTA